MGLAPFNTIVVSSFESIFSKLNTRFSSFDDLSIVILIYIPERKNKEQRKLEEKTRNFSFSVISLGKNEVSVFSVLVFVEIRFFLSDDLSMVILICIRERKKREQPKLVERKRNLNCPSILLQMLLKDFV